MIVDIRLVDASLAERGRDAAKGAEKARTRPARPSDRQQDVRPSPWGARCERNNLTAQDPGDPDRGGRAGCAVGEEERLAADVSW